MMSAIIAVLIYAVSMFGLCDIPNGSVRATGLLQYVGFVQTAVSRLK